MSRDELRAAILGSDDLPREPADVPWELGGEKLYVRGLTAAEKDRWVRQNMPDGDFVWTEGFTAGLVAATLVDEGGIRVFDDADTEALGGKGASVLAGLFAQAMRLSGMSQDAGGEIEAGFTGAQSGASSSG